MCNETCLELMNSDVLFLQDNEHYFLSFVYFIIYLNLDVSC